MQRLKRAMRPAFIIALGLTVAALAAPVALADSQVPQPPGAVDNRGYELVTPVDKGNSTIYDVHLAATGDKVLYTLLGAAPGSPTGFSPMFSAQRTDQGWVSTNFLPPRSEMYAPNYTAGATTPDLSSAVVSAFEGLGSTSTAPDITVALLDSGQQTLLQQFPVFIAGQNGIGDVASSDLRHVFVIVPYPIGDASHQPGTSNVYDIGSGTPVLVSRMPATNAAPECGIPHSAGSGTIGFASGDEPTRVSEHWVSTDGSRAFFQSRGDDALNGCVAPIELYMRDLNAAATTLISGPPVTGDPDNGVDRFLQASPDGSVVFYRTATSLDPADDADGNSSDMDIYMWTAATGRNVCITCAVANANVDTLTNSPATGATNTDAIVSEDLSHVYFTSQERLADAPSAATSDAPNLYVWTKGHSTIHFVARTDGIVNGGRYGGDITPDGNVLIFYSSQPSLNALTGQDNGGFAQYYRYDDRDQSVTCVSCPPAGAATGPAVFGLTYDVHAVGADLHAVTADGSKVFFVSPDPLVPQDVNGTYDLYEWHDGAVSLITSGTFAYDPADEAPQVAGVSSSGHDLFFIDFEAHTAQVQERTPALYDARIDGGFPPPASPPASCQADACHGTPIAPPSLATPGSGSLTGGDNVAPGTFSVAKPSRAQLATFARTGRVTLRVRVSGDGAVSALAKARIAGSTRTVGRASKHVSHAGTTVLSLHLTRAAARQLARAGRLSVVLTVSFSGAAGTKRLVLSLKAPPGRRHAVHLHATARGR